MNRINKKLQEDKKLLSIYFTAGYPGIDDTVIHYKGSRKKWGRFYRNWASLQRSFGRWAYDSEELHKSAEERNDYQ